MERVRERHHLTDPPPPFSKNVSKVLVPCRRDLKSGVGSRPGDDRIPIRRESPLGHSTVSFGRPMGIAHTQPGIAPNSVARSGHRTAGGLLMELLGHPGSDASFPTGPRGVVGVGDGEAVADSLSRTGPQTLHGP